MNLRFSEIKRSPCLYNNFENIMFSISWLIQSEQLDVCSQYKNYHLSHNKGLLTAFFFQLLSNTVETHLKFLEARFNKSSQIYIFI